MPETKEPSVYIVTLNWNGWEETVDCLKYLKKCTYRNFHVVIVDNASKDDSLINIRRWANDNSVPLSEYLLKSRNDLPQQVIHAEEQASGFRRIELIKSLFNSGFCTGNNIGLEFGSRAKADYLLILNNDTICEPDFLEPMVKTGESGDHVGLVGGLICYANSPETVWWAGGTFNSFLETKRIGDHQPLSEVELENIRETDWVSGCMTLIPRRIFESVGGYDEQFFIWSEEWDLSLRVRRKGYKLFFVPSAKIYHKIGKALGIMKPLDYYYATRNNLLLKRKYLSLMMRIVFFLFWFIPRRIVRYTQFAIQGRFDMIHAGLSATKDYFFGNTGKWDKQA